MSHTWLAIKTGRRYNLRNCLQPGWKDLSIRYSKLTHTQWNWRETDSWELPLPKAPKLDWSIERPADLRLTLKQCSNRENYITLRWGEDGIRSIQLPQNADPTRMVIYDVLESLDLCLSIKCFLSWTRVYASLKLKPIVWLWPITCV